jgi:hypothetical protein
METLNIYPNKGYSKKLIILCFILEITSIVITIFDSELRINSTIFQVVFTILFIFTINIIKDIGDYRKSSKIKVYINFKKEIISYTLFTMLVVLILIFAPFSFTLIGLLGIVIFGFMLAYEASKILSTHPSVILKEESFINKSALLSIGEINYSEIKDIFIFTRRGSKQLAVVIDRLDEKLKKLSLLNRILNRNKKFLTISSTSVDIPLEELETLLKNRINLNIEPESGLT